MVLGDVEETLTQRTLDPETDEEVRLCVAFDAHLPDSLARALRSSRRRSGRSACCLCAATSSCSSRRPSERAIERSCFHSKTRDHLGLDGAAPSTYCVSARRRPSSAARAESFCCCSWMLDQATGLARRGNLRVRFDGVIRRGHSPASREQHRADQQRQNRKLAHDTRVHERHRRASAGAVCEACTATRGQIPRTCASRPSSPLFKLR